MKAFGEVMKIRAMPWLRCFKIKRKVKAYDFVLGCLLYNLDGREKMFLEAKGGAARKAW